MNYKLVLATALATASLSACSDSHRTIHRDSQSPAIQSGTTSTGAGEPIEKSPMNPRHTTKAITHSGASSPDSITYEETSVSYSRTPNRGGMTSADRNLRYGLVGNGTGMGTEDTTSKFMTDNDSPSDPKVSLWPHSQGALSQPTDDQDALKDIKSGTSFDSDYYDIDR